MNSTMNDLALLAIGIGFGVGIALIAAMVYALYSANVQLRRDTASSHKTISDWLQKNYSENTKLRLEVTTALSRLDAERLYDASVSLQRLVKSLALQVDTMQRAIYAQPAQPAIDFTAGGMSEEAEDDARMLAERNRWAAIAQQQAPGTGIGRPEEQINDPLAGLSPEERRLRTLEYFEKRRAAAAGFPYQPASQFADQFASQPASTPPAAGSGAYASLFDLANQIPPPPAQPVDFSGLEPEEGAELTEKGEFS